jgi:predicted nucleic acid-binding protein
MATSPRRIYWDACAWIALIQNEKIRASNGRLLEDRGGLCRVVIEAAKAGAVEILTSTLSLAEVCKDPAIRSQGADAVSDFFENDYLLLVNVDRLAGERARRLMTGGYSGLKPPDAVHVATAAVSGVEEMHTFDDKLLNLDGLIDKADGTKLKICKPDPGGPPAPLLDAIKANPVTDGVPQPTANPLSAGAILEAPIDAPQVIAKPKDPT